MRFQLIFSTLLLFFSNFPFVYIKYFFFTHAKAVIIFQQLFVWDDSALFDISLMSACGECFSLTLRVFKRFFLWMGKNISRQKLGVSASLVCLNHSVAVSLFIPLIQKLIFVAFRVQLIQNNTNFASSFFTLFISHDFRLFVKFDRRFLRVIKQYFLR